MCCEAATEFRSFQSNPRTTWIYSPQTVEGWNDTAKHLQHPTLSPSASCLSPDKKWDAVFLKCLWILGSFQRVVCLRLREQKVVPSLGCGVLTVHFKELLWLEVLQGILLERDAPAARWEWELPSLDWANSQCITYDLVTKLLSMLKVKSQSVSIWPFPEVLSFPALW